MLDTYIFDIDGTLVNSETAVLSSLQLVLSKYFQIEKTLPELEFSLGITGAKIMESFDINPELGLSYWHEELPAFRPRMTTYPGVTKLINGLIEQDQNVAIVTSKTDEEFVDEVSRFDFTNKIQTVITASKTTKHKPNPEPLLLALTELDVPASQAIYFGDTIYDLKCAHQAQAKFGLASWGAHDHGQFTSADYRFENPLDILTLTTQK